MLKSVLLVSLLAVVGLAQAEDSSYNDGVKRPAASHQNLSKRPYVAPVERAAVIEGNAEDVKNVEAEKNLKKLNLFNLGRRPYVEKNTD